MVIRKKIRKKSDWKHWKELNSRHQAEIWATHLAVIAGVFIFAACL